MIEYTCSKCGGVIVNHPSCEVKEPHCSRCCPVIAKNRKPELHLSLPKLRSMKPKDFFDLDSIKFVCNRHRTLAVVVPYYKYQEMNHSRDTAIIKGTKK